jgi:hypothetical protein
VVSPEPELSVVSPEPSVVSPEPPNPRNSSVVSPEPRCPRNPGTPDEVLKLPVSVKTFGGDTRNGAIG